ncbi:threonylcarbamoyladenosine tRNA methylthiotransferase MtaB [Sphingomonas palmae]|uniref:Threonylcarbamoyladenosine tRNA methylthiotransferase MtaB n=1 Tax=Sphingomonas palmae TaxID=1855283 RepID=A0A1H7ICE4_9SPHN|nr:MiaB/RimO family radical SAM methylthiotransferase [Sphingomonas palmae]SEK59200.1 threonylcarbamoyladenosine tRNA methylthiotransferase MtaB [Sphingomonas palmae]
MSAFPRPVITLGCRLNIAESEAIRQLLPAHGRDVAVVNSCGVTNQAVKDTRAAIRRLRRDRPGVELIVTGCASDMDRAAFEAMPEVDRVVGNAAKLLPATWGPRANMPPPRRHTRGFVGVQNGCDHACTFCAIPQGRGSSRSDPIGAVVEHVAELIERGQREVVLSGVDLTSYDDHGARLPVLIERLLAAVPALGRLRLSSLDPAEVDDHLFALLTEEPRVMPHVHLSLQAGDDLILKRMRRRHSRAQAITLAQRLKIARPEITIGADLIAGFPTESEPAHANTLAMIDDADITHTHVFPYSPRDRTPAARMPQVAPEIARTRAAALRQASAARRADWLATQVGTVQPVLVEQPGDRGHTPAFADLHLSTAAPVGTIVNARVTAATSTHLIGTPE